MSELKKELKKKFIEELQRAEKKYSIIVYTLQDHSFPTIVDIALTKEEYKVLSSQYTMKLKPDFDNKEKHAIKGAKYIIFLCDKKGVGKAYIYMTHNFGIILKNNDVYISRKVQAMMRKLMGE